MSVSHRIQKSRSNLSNQGRLMARVSQRRPTLETFRGRAKTLEVVEVENETRPKSVFLVARRPPLSDHPFIWRWLARFVYERIQWAPDYGIEYQGVYTDEAEARWAASGQGMFLIELPLNASLPTETCQYGVHDFPLSEASHEYRNRKFQYVAVPCGQLERLQEKIRATDPIVGEMRAKAV